MKKVCLLIGAWAIFSCQGPTPATESSEDDNPLPALGMHPNWTEQSSIYEVNIRQHTPEGTINAFTNKLGEIKGLGVEILWIMPVQPIGLKNRKGALGSYYSIRDHTAVNPEFGTMEDFKNLVDKAHELEMKVILDWVANHSSFDHMWLEEHRDWYTQVDGEVVSPNDDWTDVADLNYDKPEMRQAMLEAMKFWLVEADIDGFRCDVAYLVPMDFWNKTRVALDSIKPVFMLAEAEGPEYHDQAFDMTYGWEFHHLINKIAKGEKELTALDQYQAKMDTLYDKNDFRMLFTTNHDENSWSGTARERMGVNVKNFFVICATFPNGMPLIYSGQEYGLDKRLRFFDKDTISATDSTLYEWYQGIIRMKMNHPALKMGNLQGNYDRIENTHEDIFAYIRQSQGHYLLVAINFGDRPGTIKLPANITGNRFEDAISGKEINVLNDEIVVTGHSYKLIAIAE